MTHTGAMKVKQRAFSLFLYSICVLKALTQAGGRLLANAGPSGSICWGSTRSSSALLF